MNKDAGADDGEKYVMVRALLKHLFVERILPLLPIESTLQKYSEVESDETFIRCRSVIMDVSISQSINLVVETGVETIELILQGESVLSNRVSEESIQSILVLARLLSDNLEYYWDHLDSKRRRHQEFDSEVHEKQNRVFTGSVVGYSTHRPCFHTTTPHNLDSDVAGKLLDICKRIKFNTSTLNALLGMSHNLYGNTSTISSNILPEYQSFLKQNDYPEYTLKVDRTVGYLLRFVAASNPVEYSRYIRITVLKPLLENHQSIEVNVIQHIELFGGYYITSRNLFKFLEMIKGLSNSIKKTIYHCLLLLYASKAMSFWIMSRPKDYAWLMASMKKYSTSSTPETTSASTAATSSSNVSNSTPIPSAATHHFSSNAPSNSISNVQSIYQSHHTSHSSKNVYGAHNNDKSHSHSTLSSHTVSSEHGDSIENETECDVENCRTIALSLFDDVYSTFNVSTLLTTITNYSSASTPQTASSSSQPSQLMHSPQQQTQHQGATLGVSSGAAPFSSSFAGPFSPPLSSALPASSSPPANYMSSPGSEHNSSQTLPPEILKTITGDSSTHSFNLEDSFNPLKKNYDPETVTQQQPEVPHIANTLELYTSLDENESISHTSVLRFLVILSLLDVDVFTELNSTSFRKLPDVKKSDESIWTAEADDKDKEKSQGGIKYLAHGLKRLTILPTSKRKSVKFLTMLLRNLNGSLLVSDVALLNTLRTLVTLTTLTASASLAESELSCVTFSRRLFPALVTNLDLGEAWLPDVKANIFLQKCLLRYPLVYGRLQIEFFAAAIQLEQVQFLNHLQWEEVIEASNLRRASLYTEGFRVFFQLLTTIELRRSVAYKTSNFFKTLFYSIPDTLLKAYPYFEEEVTDIISAILDGSILKEIGEYTILKNGTHSTPSPVISGSPCQSVTFNPSSSPSGPENNGGTHNILPVLSSSSSSSETSSINSHVNSPEPQFSNLVAPRARRVSMASSFIKRASLLSSPGTSDSDKAQISSRSQAEGALSSGLSRSTKSPLSQARSRRASDEGFSKLSRSVNVASIVENVLTTTSDEHDDARRIMVNIFSIFKRLASFFILPHVSKVDEAWASADFKNIIKPIFVAIIDSDVNLQKTAQSFMDMLINYMPDFDDGTSPENVNGFYLLCSYTVTLFSTALFDLKLNSSKREVILDILVKFLQVRSNLAKILETSCSEEALLDAEASTFPLISGTLGRALFVSLYSNKSSVQKLLKTSYTEFLQAIRFHEKTMGELPVIFADMLAFAEAMSQDNYVASGSVAFQRRLRLNLLKYIRRPDAVLFDSMKVIHRKWLALSRSKELSQEELADFRSFAGILASICGVLLSVDDVENSSSQYKDWQKYVTIEMNYFINKQCQWLNNPDLLTRENSKDILSVELHPLAFKLLFSNLKPRMVGLEAIELSEAKNDLNFVLLEQIITIIRTIIKRDDYGKNLIMFSLDILNFIDQLIEIVNKISHGSSKFYKAVIHMSKMFRSLEVNEANLGIAGHYLIKNRWLGLVTNWFNLTLVKDYDFENLSKPHREMDLKRRDVDILYIDTLIESSKALSFLTKDVPLEVPASVSEEELKRSKSVVFGNYFNILLKGLEKSTDLERYPASLKHKISILSENVIISLTNLSNANVGAGLRYSLPMGYSKNRNIRIAFLKVFVNIVSNYSTYKNFSDQHNIAAFNEIILVTINHPYYALKSIAICPANDIDSLAAGFVNAFDSRNACHILVAELLNDEIKKSPRYMDILRRNSGATRALSLFSRLKGGEYLSKTLTPVLRELMDKEEFFEIERDHNDCDVQSAHFVKYMRKLIDSITGSVSFFPPELFYICQTIYTSVNEKFPEYAYVAVGSFVFLRFFCPALVNPEPENIVNLILPKHKRSFISLAKVIQSMANGSDNLNRWPCLNAHAEFLKDCRDRIFGFLKEICRTDRKIDIPVNLDPKPLPFEANFLHKFLYYHELEIRKAVLDDMENFSYNEVFKNSVMMVDKNMALIGQPKVEFRNEIPSYIQDHTEEYPQLYEFMSRHAFRKVDALNDHSSFVRETMSTDGLPILTLSFGKFTSSGLDIDTVVYRTFQIYARLWPVKHYLMLDCTCFDDTEVDVAKLTSLFTSLIPPAAIQNCKGYYYFNVSEAFMLKWGKLLDHTNPYVSSKVPHHFINSYTDSDFSKSLGVSGKSLEIIQDVRVSLHDITLFDEHNKRFTPVSLKIGNRFFQVLHETTRQYKMPGWDRLVDIKFNDVYEIGNVLSVNVSSITGVASEFTVDLDDGRTLIFCSSKYLEIVKMFYYALDRIEEEYGQGISLSEDRLSSSDISDIETKETRQTIAHLLLIVFVGLLNEDDAIKSVSYNLMAATQETFGLICGTHFLNTPEVYVPSDCSTFLCLVSKCLGRSAPDLTLYIWKYLLEALQSDIIPQNYVPQTVLCLSYWAPNLHKYVYSMDEEEGVEAMSHILRTLIKLTVADANFTTIYLQHIWILLAVDGRLTPLIVEEVINHALDRDSENRDWKKALCLFNVLPTVEVASHIIGRLMGIIKSFLPGFKLEASTQSWSELAILVKTGIPLFFESPLMAQMYLPEVLFIVSLLVDVGPNEIRSSLHELLMNVCHSLIINDALPGNNREILQGVCNTLSRQRLKFMFGFSQDKGRLLQNFSASSFASKFAALEHFATNIILLMECSASSEAAHWKTRYKKYLIDAVFNSDSFLSARAMMILGILAKTSASEILCRNLLAETMNVIAMPSVTELSTFLIIAHTFTYGKLVEGLDPSLDLAKQLFWFSTVVSDSVHSVVFEGGLIFMTNCLNRLYQVHFQNSDGERTLTSVLIESRVFGSSILDEFEKYGGPCWTEKNFSHNILALISRGLSIPFVKSEALDCLASIFKNTFREHQTRKSSSHYLCYMFFMFLFQAPEQYVMTLESAEFEDDFVELNENYKLPKTLADWLSSNDCCSRITLYQSAILFNSSISDEPCKLRYSLVLRYLIKKNPICVFNIYVIIREELRRISTLDLNLECVKVSFDIIRLLVKYTEFNDMVKFNHKSIENIKRRGLGSILNIKSFDPSYSSTLANLQDHSEIIYNRKRLMTMLLSRMTCYI